VSVRNGTGRLKVRPFRGRGHASSAAFERTLDRPRSGARQFDALARPVETPWPGGCWDA
jgi:hypothetical protein